MIKSFFEFIFKILIGILDLIQSIIFFSYTHANIRDKFFLFFSFFFKRKIFHLKKKISFYDFVEFLFFVVLSFFYVFYFFFVKLFIFFFYKILDYIKYVYFSFKIICLTVVFFFDSFLCIVFDFLFISLEMLLSLFIILFEVLHKFFIVFLEQKFFIQKNFYGVFIIYKNFLKIVVTYLNRSFVGGSIKNVLQGIYIKDKESRDIEVYLNTDFFEPNVHQDSKLISSSVLDSVESSKFLYMMRSKTYLSDTYISEQAGIAVNYLDAAIYYNVYNFSKSNNVMGLGLSNLYGFLKSQRYLRQRSFVSKSDYLYWVYPWFASYFVRNRDILGDNTNNSFSTYNSSNTRPNRNVRSTMRLRKFGFYTYFLYNSIFSKSNLYTDDSYFRFDTLPSGKGRKSFFYNTWFMYWSDLVSRRLVINYNMFRDFIDGLKFVFIYFFVFAFRRFFEFCSIFSFVKTSILEFFFEFRVSLIKFIYFCNTKRSFVFYGILNFDIFIFSFILNYFIKQILKLFYKLFYILRFIILYFFNIIYLFFIKLPMSLIIDINFYYIWIIFNFFPILMKFIFLKFSEYYIKIFIKKK